MFNLIKKLFKKEQQISPDEYRKTPIEFIVHDANTGKPVGETKLTYEEYKYLMTFDQEYYYIRKNGDDLR